MAINAIFYQIEIQIQIKITMINWKFVSMESRLALMEHRSISGRVRASSRLLRGELRHDVRLSQYRVSELVTKGLVETTVYYCYLYAYTANQK